MRLIFLLMLAWPWTVACSALGPVLSPEKSRLPGRKAPPVEEPLALQQLVKADVDRMADIGRREVFYGLRVLAEKLYRRNPGEWRKSGASSLEEAVERLAETQATWHFPELEGKRGVEAIHLAFREDFQGDRVLALMGGLGGMLHTSFNEKSGFFMTDDLDPQQLYNSARNVEILVWKLSNTRNAQGQLFLLSNEAASMQNPANLSFEREFGKMIGELDMLALIMAGKMNRTIVKVVQSLATAIFLPVGFVK